MNCTQKILFAILTFVSSLSAPCVTQAYTDTVSPNVISDLSITSISTSTATLTWSAPGDYAQRLQSRYVIVISVDGLGSEYIKPLLTPGTNQLTNIKRLIDEGAGTLKARTDADYSITLPNHTSMITGRGVTGVNGHNWTTNIDPVDTLAGNKGSYIKSMFDVAHDNGSSTALWAGKSKFSLYQSSYSSTTGAIDTIGTDNGRDKIDYDYVIQSVPAATLTSDFINEMSNNPYHISFVHYQDTDSEGHTTGWSTDRTSTYAATAKAVDTEIGNILDMIENDSTLDEYTTVILTADHGGHSTEHYDVTNYLDFTIPFLVWGAGVTEGSDLYDLNGESRLAPATTTLPSYSGTQPIRNGDAGNLALDLLGFSAVPDSTINVNQDLVIQNLEAVSSYDVRYSTSTITSGNWTSATQATDEPTPSIASTTEEFTVRSLRGGTPYFFAIKSADDIPNNSIISNVVSSTTIAINPTLSFSDDVAQGPISSDTISANWANSVVTKWSYDSDGTCSNVASEYTYTTTSIPTQTTTANNGQFICIYGEDSLGNKASLASSYDINISIRSSGSGKSAIRNTETVPSASNLESVNTVPKMLVLKNELTKQLIVLMQTLLIKLQAELALLQKSE